jgi:diguanylate cyclase (GGDEF)-like protein
MDEEPQENPDQKVPISEEHFRMTADLISDFSYALSVNPAGVLSVEWLEGPIEIISDIPGNFPIQFAGLIHPEDRPTAMKMRAKVLSGESAQAEMRILKPTGEAGWIQQHEKPVWEDSQQRVVKILGAVKDITERKNTEETLQKTNETLSFWVNELKQLTREAILLNEMSDLLQNCNTIDEAYTVITQYAQKLFPELSGAIFTVNIAKNLAEVIAQWGTLPPGELVFQPESCWAYRRGRVHIVDGTTFSLSCSHAASSQSKEQIPYICIPLKTQDQTTGILHLTGVSSILNTERWELLALTATERIAVALSNIKLREILRMQSIRDPLTGLFNRVYMEETLERELRRAVRHERSLVLVMIDIDFMKIFNDKFGFTAGDLLLKEFGTFLINQVRYDDIASRYGGDEFTLVLPESSLKDAYQRANEIREGFQEITLSYLGQPLERATVSMGLAGHPQNGSTRGALLHSADMALFKSKRSGRNQVTIARPTNPLSIKRLS